MHYRGFESCFVDIYDTGPRWINNDNTYIFQQIVRMMPEQSQRFFNILTPVVLQYITWTNSDLLCIDLAIKNKFQWNSNKIMNSFFCEKTLLKMSFAKCQPLCTAINKIIFAIGGGSRFIHHMNVMMSLNLIMKLQDICMQICSLICTMNKLVSDTRWSLIFICTRMFPIGCFSHLSHTPFGYLWFFIWFCYIGI